MLGRVFVFVVGVGLVTACANPQAFRCDEPTDCIQAGVVGTCELTGYCSYPDPQCESGRRYGRSGPETGDVCVGGEGTETGTATSGGTTTGATTGGPSGSDSSGGPTTGPTRTADGGPEGGNDTDDDTGGSGGTTRGGGCAPLGSGCVDDGDCCECGMCQAGSCAPAVGASCGELQCSDYLFGAVIGGAGAFKCHAFPAKLMTGTCDAGGACVLPSLDECSQMAGLQLIRCASRCGREETACAAQMPVAEFREDEFCYVDAASPMCGGLVCRNFADRGEVRSEMCDANATCSQTTEEDCGLFTCEAGACNTACTDDMQCVTDGNCAAPACVPD